MRKIAAILLFIFAFVQAGSVVSALFSDPGYVFVVDEEKGKDEIKSPKKYPKDFITYIYTSEGSSHITNTAFQLTENIQLPPYLEKLTPPPNFC